MFHETFFPVLDWKHTVGRTTMVVPMEEAEHLIMVVPMVEESRFVEVVPMVVAEH